MPRRIALGIDEHLQNFAEMNSAETWKQIVGSDPEEWENFFVEVMNEGKAAILFNLDGVQIWAGVSRAASGRGGMTDKELLLIYQNRHWWGQIEWFRQGVLATNPFD